MFKSDALESGRRENRFFLAELAVKRKQEIGQKGKSLGEFGWLRPVSGRGEKQGIDFV